MKHFLVVLMIVSLCLSCSGNGKSPSSSQTNPLSEQKNTSQRSISNALPQVSSKSSPVRKISETVLEVTASDTRPFTTYVESSTLASLLRTAFLSTESSPSLAMDSLVDSPALTKAFQEDLLRQVKAKNPKWSEKQWNAFVQAQTPAIFQAVKQATHDVRVKRRTLTEKAIREITQQIQRQIKMVNPALRFTAQYRFQKDHFNVGTPGWMNPVLDLSTSAQCSGSATISLRHTVALNTPVGALSQEIAFECACEATIMAPFIDLPCIHTLNDPTAKWSAAPSFKFEASRKITGKSFMDCITGSEVKGHFLLPRVQGTITAKQDNY